MIKITKFDDVNDIGAIAQQFDGNGVDFSTATDYGEPGYDKPMRSLPILFANWNYVSKEAYEALEKAGYALEWADEWVTDDDAMAYRTSPDSFCWRPSFTLHECTVYGHTIGNIRDCIREYKASRDGDEWGNCMAWLFAIAHEMCARSLDIPDEWQFQPGAGCCAPDYGREWDRWETEYCATVKDHVLERFGALLYRHSETLKKRGLSY
jgi:hypothetical protein